MTASEGRSWISRVGVRASTVLAFAAFVLRSAVVVAQSAPGTDYSYKVLYDFCSLQNCTDGELSQAGLVRDAEGNVYGTTWAGGSSGFGTVFKLDKYGKETVLYNFTGGADGGNPTASLVLDSTGNLYGTAPIGGDLRCNPKYGCGTVFKMDLTGHETVLHRFAGGRDGMLPHAGVIRDAAGNLYGTTAYGGDINRDCGATGYGCGTVFRLDKNGKETVLHRFAGGKDFGVPLAGLVRDKQGNLYGTTYGNGTDNPGTLYRVTKSGKETVLYRFKSGNDGSAPLGTLIMDASGNLYGTTSGDNNDNYGTVFKLNKKGKETVLWHFQGPPDGREPHAGVVMDAAGNLYGTTHIGGDVNCPLGQGAGCGTVFKLTKTGNETILYSFTGGSDGAGPQAGLLRDAKANLYGTTEYVGYSNFCPNGMQGCGVVFRITP